MRKCAAMLCVLFGCTDETQAVHAAELLGMRDVTVTDTAYFWKWGCGQDDGVRYTIMATTAAGTRAEAIICCGPWYGKGCTIRTR